jgi:hypothetical protein
MAGVMAERAAPAHCDHVVQLYRESVELADAVATFFVAGFERNEPAVSIATAAHWPLIAERLARRGWNADELESQGLLTVRDAESTLAAISEDDGPSLRTFNDVVGGLLGAAAAHDPARRVRAFGEMVEVLVQRGDAAAADTLERYWNDLAHKRNFTLLCGYKVDLFDPATQLGLLPQVYRSHAEVLAPAESERLELAVNRALVDVLGAADAEKVLDRAQRQGTKAPAPHLALGWISANMPRAAERVLAAARLHFADVD